MINQSHDGRAFSWSVLIVSATCSVHSDNKLEEMLAKRCIKILFQSNFHVKVEYKVKIVVSCSPILLVCFTCSVLSNQRLQLFHWLPPPCSIWIAAQLLYISAATLGIAPSKQRVKMLLWIADTDSWFFLSRKKEHTFRFTDSIDIKHRGVSNTVPIAVVGMHMCLWPGLGGSKSWNRKSHGLISDRQTHDAKYSLSRQCINWGKLESPNCLKAHVWGRWSTP